MAKIEIELLEFSGLVSTIQALRLPHGREPRSYTHFSKSVSSIYNEQINVSWVGSVGLLKKDLDLLSNLVKSGDEHAKCLRGITVGVKINAPIWFYRELETYRIGRERLSSESTMHIECKNLSGEELEDAKDKIEMGHTQVTVDTISYQTLRRVYFQRKDHRLPMWHTFCDWIKTLPLAKELITCVK